MINFKKLFFCFSFAVFFFVGCNCNNPQRKIDNIIAETPVKLSITRFEQELFSAKDFSVLEKKHSAFFKLYCEQILQGGDKSHLIESDKLLTGFVNNASIKGLYDTVEKKFADFNPYEHELSKAFEYHQYYFPKSKLPKIYTFISEFSYGCITADSIVGIGLDLFLGEDYPYYKSLDFPNFIIKKCTPKNVVISAMKAYGQSMVKQDNSKRKLIDKMVEAGKTMYYLEKVLPYTDDSLKMGYSNIQLAWCHYNEYKIWEFFIKHNLLFTTDVFDIGHYIGDAPVTPGMPPASPGNIGTWVGWQIVKQYMQAHTEITFTQLMNETDGQKILEASKYKPIKKSQ